MKCKYEGSGVWEGRCVGTKEVDPCPGYEKCNRFRPNCKTNADHICAMSDEELAYFLHGIYCEGHANGISHIYDAMIPHYKEWLKQPYGGGT